MVQFNKNPERDAFFVKALDRAINEVEFNFVEKMFEAAQQYKAIYMSVKQRAWLEEIAGAPYTWQVKQRDIQ